MAWASIRTFYRRDLDERLPDTGATNFVRSILLEVMRETKIDTPQRTTV